MTEEKHDSICAWGTIKNKMNELCSKADIDFEKYVIHDGKNLYIDMNNQQRFDIKLKGLCTYDKIGLINDMAKGCKLHYGVEPKLEDMEKEFDLIIDATGFYRQYLPKIKKIKTLRLWKYISWTVGTG